MAGGRIGDTGTKLVESRPCLQVRCGCIRSLVSSSEASPNPEDFSCQIDTQFTLRTCISASRTAFMTFRTVTQCTFGVPVCDHSTVSKYVSVNTSPHTSLPHPFARVKPNVVHCNLGVRARWSTRSGRVVTVVLLYILLCHIGTLPKFDHHRTHKAPRSHFCVTLCHQVSVCVLVHRSGKTKNRQSPFGMTIYLAKQIQQSVNRTPLSQLSFDH